MIPVYRLSSSRYPANSGVGAAITGGRWNRIGTETIYTAASRSLATLEILVHYAVMPKNFQITPIEIPADIVIPLSISDLPPGWNDLVPTVETVDFAESVFLKTAALRVPSAIVAEERNYVLNPKHREFKRIVFRPSRPMRFDPRLWE